MSCDDHVTVRWWAGPFSSRYLWWSMWFIIRCVMNVTEDRPRISGELLFKSDRRYVVSGHSKIYGAGLDEHAIN